MESTTRSQEAPHEKRPFIAPLHGLRGITVVSVILLHFSGSIITLLPSIGPVIRLSNRICFRMDLFFMLSGFIISHVYLSRMQKLNGRTYLDFLIGRLIRLYPSYLAAFAALVICVLGARLLDLRLGGSYQWSAVPVRLLMLQAWPLLSWSTWSWNYPTWFLSALWFAYLALVPFVWLLVHRVTDPRRLYFWVFACPAVWILVSHLKALEEFHMVVRVAAGFLSGGALFVLYRSGCPLIAFFQRHLDKLAVCYLLMLLVISVFPHPALPVVLNACLVMGTPLLLAGMTSESSIVARLMTRGPLMWLGSISYALFLTHGVVQKLVTALLPATPYAQSSLPVRLLVGLIYLAAILAAAVALHECIEKPCTNFLRRRWKQKKLARSAPPLKNLLEGSLEQKI